MPIRLRVALVFALALAAAFALGGWLFVSQLGAAMLKSTDAALAARLAQASRYTADDEQGNLPASFLTSKPGPGEYIVQVVGPSGRVIRLSQNAGKTPLLSPAELRQAEHGQVLLTRTARGKPERVLAGPYGGEHGWVAIAAVSLQPSEDTLRQVTEGLLVGGGAFVIVGGIGAYWLARAALAPVERLRREVAALSERDTGATLRVPGTRDELAAVASAAEEADRLTRITDDLLLLARGDEDKLSLQFERIGIAALLAASAERARSRAAAAGVTCQVSAAPSLTAVVDAGRIRQAVDNLVDNALRFAPRGTQVMISAEIAGPSLVIEVRDCGPGFPPDFLPHAFERFRRPGQDRARSAGGAGLGLAIVQAIALAHEGRVVASNGPEGGAAVRLEVPHR